MRKAWTLALAVCLAVVGLAGAQLGLEHGTSMDVNDRDMLDIYRPNVYVIDLRKASNLNKPLAFKCSSGPKALDLNLTFVGFSSRMISVLGRV